MKPLTGSTYGLYTEASSWEERPTRGNASPNAFTPEESGLQPCQSQQWFRRP